MMARRRYKPPKDRGWFHRDWRLYVMLILPVAYYLIFCYNPMIGVIIAFQKCNTFKGMWNSFQDALYYIGTKAYQPLQLKLYHIIKGSKAVDIAAMEGGSSAVASSVSESIEPVTI